MIKLAMIAIHKELAKSGLKSKMLLQVHDELVFDVPANELSDVQPIIKHCMENAMKLPCDVPLNVETGSGHNWLEAH